MADARLTQLARLLGLPRGAVDEQTAPALVRDGAATLAATLLEEAVANDDVTTAAAAIEYVDERLEFLTPFVDTETAETVRSYVQKQASGWSSP